MVLGPNTIGANHQHDMCGVVAHRLKMGRKELKVIIMMIIRG